MKNGEFLRLGSFTLLAVHQTVPGSHIFFLKFRHETLELHTSHSSHFPLK